jgi:hypothetical protein
MSISSSPLGVRTSDAVGASSNDALELRKNGSIHHPFSRASVGERVVSGLASLPLATHHRQVLSTGCLRLCEQRLLVNP